MTLITSHRQPRNRKSDAPESTIAVIGLPIATVVLFGLLTFFSIQQLRDAYRDVNAVHSRKDHLTRLLADISDLETGQRGYLLTNDPEYLTPYNVAISRIRADQLNLRAAYSQDEESLEQIAALEPLVEDKLREIAATLKLSEEGDSAAALDLVKNHHGRNVMVQIRSKIADLQVAEDIITERLDGRTQTAFFSAIIIIFSAVMLAVLATLWALSKMQTELYKRKILDGYLRKRTRQLSTLADVNTRVAAARDMRSVFGIALNEFRQLLGVREAIVRFGNGQSFRYERSTISNLVIQSDEEYVHEIFEITGKMANEENAYYRNLAEIEHFYEHAASPELRLRSFFEQSHNLLTVPLISRTRTEIGRLILLGKYDEDFDEADLSTAVQMALTMSVAIENVQLIDQSLVAAQRKDEFLAMLGHELRNPLAGILSSSEAIKLAQSEDLQNGDSNLSELNEVILRQSAHMSEIVNDLLDVSRIARGKIVLRKTAFDLREMLNELVADAKRTHEGRIIVGRIPEDASDFMIVGDRTRIVQSVNNLIHNACKFSAPGTKVVVELFKEHSDAQEIEIRVIDQGVGLSPQDLEAVFDIFHQSSTTIDRSQGGLGLGLTLAKGLVEMHNGSVKVFSAGPNRGSTFTIRLPLMNQIDGITPHRLEERNADVDEEDQPQTPITVLAIDDRRDALLPIAALLKRAGHRVLTAPDGLTGLQIATKELPDMILCDIGLPGEMNGYDVVRAIRQDKATRYIYAVALSGYSQKSDIDNAAQAGFDYHVAKPVAFKTLRMLISQRPSFNQQT